MNWEKPPAQEVWRAIEIYLGLAYAGAGPSLSVKARLEALRAAGEAAFYECASLERDANTPARKFSLRLGNHFYPHMKLVIEPIPNGAGSMFRADTHDKHIRPAVDSPEHASFAKLMNDNQKLSESIESAWENAGLCTFKQYLRDDLARRTGRPNVYT